MAPVAGEASHAPTAANRTRELAGVAQRSAGDGWIRRRAVGGICDVMWRKRGGGRGGGAGTGSSVSAIEQCGRCAMRSSTHRAPRARRHGDDRWRQHDGALGRIERGVRWGVNEGRSSARVWRIVAKTRDIERTRDATTIRARRGVIASDARAGGGARRRGGRAAGGGGKWSSGARSATRRAGRASYDVDPQGERRRRRRGSAGARRHTRTLPARDTWWGVCTETRTDVGRGGGGGGGGGAARRGAAGARGARGRGARGGQARL